MDALADDRVLARRVAAKCGVAVLVVVACTTSPITTRSLSAPVLPVIERDDVVVIGGDCRLPGGWDQCELILPG